jgi:hypothetical protein
MSQQLSCHHAKELALELGYSPEEGRKFMHEYIFEWEINCMLHILVFDFPFKYVFVHEFPSLFRAIP